MVRPLQEVLRSPSLLTSLKQDPAAFRFPSGASLVVAVKDFQPHTFVKEHEADDGSRSLTVTGPMKNLLDLLSSSINFSYTLVLPPDGTTGTRQPNGTWTGLVGMLTRKEADIALGPVVMTESLNTVVDFSQPVVIDSLRVMGLRGTPEVDLWGFVLPFRPMVWLAIGATLLVTWAIMTLMMKLVFYTNTGRRNAKHIARWTPFRIFFEHLRILLLQNREFVLLRGWEFLVFGSWMVVANVILWSYGGKLISGLTVRYVAQPLQDLQQLIYHSSVVAILEQDTAYIQLLRDEASVTFRDLIALEKKGRMIFLKTTEFEVAMKTLMRKGGYAFIMQDLVITNLMAVDVTQTGNCDFYTSHERFHSSLMSIIAQTHSQFLEAINARILRVAESGLYGHWLKEATPNSTTCLDQPSSITVNDPIRITNIWGLFVVLASGLALSSIVFCLEVVTARHYSSGSSRRIVGGVSFGDDLLQQVFRKHGLNSKTFRKQGFRQQAFRKQGLRQQTFSQQGFRQREFRRQGARQQAFHQHLVRIQTFRQGVRQKAVRPQDIRQQEFRQQGARQQAFHQQHLHSTQAFLEEIFTAAVATSFPLPTPPEEQDVTNLMF